MLYRGDAALGPVRRRVGSAFLRDDRDTGGVGHPQGVEEARDSATEHEGVETLRVLQGGP